MGEGEGNGEGDLKNIWGGISLGGQKGREKRERRRDSVLLAKHIDIRQLLQVQKGVSPDVAY